MALWGVEIKWGGGRSHCKSCDRIVSGHIGNVSTRIGIVRAAIALYWVTLAMYRLALALCWLQ